MAAKVCTNFGSYSADCVFSVVKIALVQVYQNMVATPTLSEGKCDISCKRDHTRGVIARFFTKISPTRGSCDAMPVQL